MSNIVIIGSGPAGVSAALYAARAGVQTTVLTKGPGALDRAELIQNYYALPNPSPVPNWNAGASRVPSRGVGVRHHRGRGPDLHRQADRGDAGRGFPCRCRHSGHGSFPGSAPHSGPCRAGGPRRELLRTCDAFFYRGRDVAVLGSGEYALHEVQALLPVAHSVTLLTGGPR